MQQLILMLLQAQMTAQYTFFFGETQKKKNGDLFTMKKKNYISDTIFRIILDHNLL